MTQLFAIMDAQYPALVLGISGLFGAVIGSFLNVVIYRLPVMLERGWVDEARQILGHASAAGEESLESTTAFNLATPRSTCPGCGHGIRWYENIPILSWLFLKGRCAECRQAISPRYPVIEFGTALATSVVIMTFGLTFQGLCACLLTWVLISLSMIDYDHKLLPDNVTLPFLWLGLIINFTGTFVPFVEAFWGAVAGYLSLWGVFWGFKLITGKEGLGYGDFKLLALLGAWLGWQSLPIVIVLSSFAGALIGGALILSGRERSNPIPFGPFLALAGWVSLLWQDVLLDWYWAIMTG